MNKTRKRIIWIGTGVLAVAIVVAAVLLFSPPKIEHVEIERAEDTPMVAYLKLESIDEDESATYSMNLCQVGSSPQKIAINVKRVDTSSNGTLIGYSLDSGEEFIKSDIYLLNTLGVNQLCARDALSFELSGDGSVVAYVFVDKRDQLYLNEYTADGQLVNQDVIEMNDLDFTLEMTQDASILLFTRDLQNAGDSDDEDRDDIYIYDIYLYIYSSGEMQQAAKNSLLSGRGQNMSDNGTVVYLTDVYMDDVNMTDSYLTFGEKETEAGTLYVKEMGEEPRMVAQQATDTFSISHDGSLIAAKVTDEDHKDNLFYQYAENDANIVEDVFQYLISGDSSTLVYTVRTDTCRG